MIRPIVVMHDKQAPKCLYWGIHHGFRITQCRRLGAFLFVCPITLVPHTLISAPDCGSVGGKRFTLTQGGRVHEGSAPSDKRPCRLIVNRGNYGIVGSINKAAELYTGVSPIQDSPKAESRLLTNHHPYRSPCIV
jgi:hypothetical protein